MPTRVSLTIATVTLALVSTSARADDAGLAVKAVVADVSRPDPDAAYWKQAATRELVLVAQPITPPRPKTTTTAAVSIQAIHDGKWIAFRLRWKDTEPNEAGRLGEFSDAVALMFPIRAGDVPPPVTMGAPDNPVHIFHWRAQYQRDALKGKPTMADLYPNMAVDIYPMEFPDSGRIERASPIERERFSPGVIQGNPQSYVKSGVDEIYAEGFSTSSVQAPDGSQAFGRWRDGEWTVVIARHLARQGGSVLQPGGRSFVTAAVWQGGQGEVGARKSVTMMWLPIVLDATAKPREQAAR